MLIKNVTRKGSKKGTAVPYSPEEAALFAVERGVKILSTSDTIYWVIRKSIQVKVSSVVPGANGSYSASASGTAQIGTTDVKTDQFYAPKTYNVSVSYKSTKDSRGLPDIEIVEFEANPLSTNPRELALKIKRKAAPKAEEKKKEEPKKEAPAPKAEEKKKEEPKKAEDKKD